MKFNLLWPITTTSRFKLFGQGKITYHLAGWEYQGDVSSGRSLCDQVTNTVFFGPPEKFINLEEFCNECKKEAQSRGWYVP